MGSIMDDVKGQIAQMDENQIREQLAKIAERREAQKGKQKEKLKNLTPEEREARKAKQLEYRQKNGEKFEAKRKEYNQRPDVVAKRKVYMKARNEKQKLLLARAKELGITA